jgi:hypothetical protein
MFSVEKLEDNIYYYTNVLDSVSEVLEYAKNNLVWSEWLASGSDEVYGEITGSKNPLPDQISYLIRDSIKKCLDHYCSETSNSFGWIPNFYTIQKYNVGAHMGPHTDSLDITQDKSPTISIVFYLNDNYEGGEIEFINQGIKIKPEAGSIVIFPSYPPYTHDPLPTISGDKYMSPAFCFKEQF